LATFLAATPSFTARRPWWPRPLKPVFHWDLAIQGSVAAAIGIAIAAVGHLGRRSDAPQMERFLGPLAGLFANQFFIDQIYVALIVKPLEALALVAAFFDRTVIDGTVDLVAKVPLAAAGVVRQFQSGLVQRYALAGVVGVLAIVVALAWQLARLIVPSSDRNHSAYERHLPRRRTSCSSSPRHWSAPVVAWLMGSRGKAAVRQSAAMTAVLTLIGAGWLVIRYLQRPDAASAPNAPFALVEAPWLVEGTSDIASRWGSTACRSGSSGSRALLSLTAVLVSWEAIDERPVGFYVLLLLLEAAMLGVFAARDVILFYVFFEFTLVPLFFLIGIWGHDEQRPRRPSSSSSTRWPAACSRSSACWRSCSGMHRRRARSRSTSPISRRASPPIRCR